MCLFLKVKCPLDLSEAITVKVARIGNNIYRVNRKNTIRSGTIEFKVCMLNARSA